MRLLIDVAIVRSLHMLCVAGAVLTASASASADTHYYAVHDATSVFGDADEGAFTSVWTNNLHSTCNALTRNFVSHELWYYTDAKQSWEIEVGWVDGGLGGWPNCYTDILFWADSRPQDNGGINIHTTGTGVVWGSWQSFQIVSGGPGSCQWSVSWNNTNIGLSTSNCPGSGRNLAAGIESTSQTTGNAKGWLSDWWELDGTGTWRNTWDNDRLCQTDINLIECNIGNPYIKSANGIGTEEVLNEGW